jgi:hypothetical protein
MFRLKGKSNLLDTCLNNNADNLCMLPERMREDRPEGTPKSLNLHYRVFIFLRWIKKPQFTKTFNLFDIDGG